MQEPTRATTPRCIAALLCAVLFVAGLPADASPLRPGSVQLYALDCGHLDVPDMGDFADTGEHAGEAGAMIVPCFLVHHPSGRWLLYDTGVGDAIAALPAGVDKFGLHFSASKSLVSQLAELGLKPGDIGIVAVSHLHADHSGNIKLFAKATFLIAQEELAYARSQPTPGGIQLPYLATLSKARVDTTSGDLDVFADGTVRLLTMPGHTPGHRVLLLELPHAGSVMVAGDLFHTRENYEKSLVPQGNWSRAETLASFDRFARIQRNTQARVVIGHSQADFDALPRFPAFLD